MEPSQLCRPPLVRLGTFNMFPPFIKKPQDGGHSGELKEDVQQKSTCFLYSPPDSIRLHRPHQKKPQHSQRRLADYRLGGLTFVTTECVLVCAELSLPAPCRSHRGLEQSVCECV